MTNRECEIILLNEYEKPWTASMIYYKTTGDVYIRTGWRKFCRENRKRVNSLLTFKLVKRGSKPVLQLCSSMHNRDCLRASSSRSQERFLTLTLTLRKSKLVSFSSVMSAYCSRDNVFRVFICSVYRENLCG